jgi:hypothetical protein
VHDETMRSSIGRGEAPQADFPGFRATRHPPPMPSCVLCIGVVIRPSIQGSVNSIRVRRCAPGIRIAGEGGSWATPEVGVRLLTDDSVPGVGELT